MTKQNFPQKAVNALLRRARRACEIIYLILQEAALKRDLGRISQTAHGLPRPLYVSFTSYPPRFGTLHKTIQSLLTQTIRADGIILWVAEKDFAALPENVLSLRQHGLRIEICEDLRSYKKIIPCLALYPNAFIVTADDDIFYGRHWLEKLLTAWSGDPFEIVCHRAHEILFLNDGTPRPYVEWRKKVRNIRHARHIFPTSGGGVLYPPGCFHGDITRSDIFVTLCPYADDVWLFWMGLLGGCSYTVTDYGGEAITWPSSQGISLLKHNVTDGGNDAQIAAMIKAYGNPMHEDHKIA
jgi:hypothetical protein